MTLVQKINVGYQEGIFVKKVARVVSNVLIVVVLIFAILLTVAVITSTRGDSQLPNLFGKALFNVETDSMKGENGFDPGSLIVVDLLNYDEANSLEVGDVITFKAYLEDSAVYLDTHRIVETLDRDGSRYYTTKGDNTVVPDKFLASAYDIVGVWTGTAIPHLGSVMKFLQSSMGFLICIVIPIAIFFVWQLYKFIALLMDRKREKAVAEIADAEDEIKKKAIAEYLAQQQAEQQSAAQTAAPEVHAPPAQPEPEPQAASDNDTSVL